jgi:hypothetical protein
MKKSMVSASVFVAVLGITTLGVGAARSASEQGDKPKPPAQADKEKPAEAKAHTMTGCLEKGANPTTFMLTNVEGTGPKTVELHADASKKLSAHVGHKIAITGPDIGPSASAKGKGEAKSASAEHVMRVNSVKMVSETCK